MLPSHQNVSRTYNYYLLSSDAKMLTLDDLARFILAHVSLGVGLPTSEFRGQSIDEKTGCMV